MQDSSKVTTSKPKITGSVYRAPIGTTLPINATSELPAAFKCMGYISEDGISNTNTPETEIIKAWGGDPVNSSVTEKSDTFKTKFIEALNPEVLKAVYNDANVSIASSGDIAIAAKVEEPDESSYVFDMILKGGALKRIVVPKATLALTGDVVYKDNEAIGYEVELTSMAVNGVTHHEYIHGAGTAASSACEITAFVIGAAIGVIDAVAHTITVKVPNGTSLTSLTPAVIVSEGATVSPASGVAQNFSTDKTYTVTAEDEVTTQAYTVTVEVEED